MATLRVEVTPSVTQNPNHHDNNQICIDMHYTNYIHGVFDDSVTFTLPIEDGITWDNIYETDECRFQECVEENLEELDVDYFAIPTVVEAIAKGYLDMKETRVVGLSCLRALSVVVEVGDFDDEVIQDYDDDDNDNDGNEGRDVKEIRAFLETCGVSFSKVSSSGGCCAICLDTMEETEVARLPCNHVFHGDCVAEMVLKGVANDSCPLCRMELIALQS